MPPTHHHHLTPAPPSLVVAQPRFNKLVLCMLAGPRAAHFTRALAHTHSSLIDLPTVQLNWKHSNTIYRHVCTHKEGVGCGLWVGGWGGLEKEKRGRDGYSYATYCTGDSH